MQAGERFESSGGLRRAKAESQRPGTTGHVQRSCVGAACVCPACCGFRTSSKSIRPPGRRLLSTSTSFPIQIPHQTPIPFAKLPRPPTPRLPNFFQLPKSKVATANRRVSNPRSQKYKRQKMSGTTAATSSEPVETGPSPATHPLGSFSIDPVLLVTSSFVLSFLRSFTFFETRFQQQQQRQPLPLPGRLRRRDWGCGKHARNACVS